MFNIRLLINDLDGIQKIIRVGPGGEFMPLEPERTILDERKNPEVDWDSIEQKIGGLSKIDGSVVFDASQKESHDVAVAEIDTEIEIKKTIVSERKQRLLNAKGTQIKSIEEGLSLLQDIIDNLS